MCKVKRCVYVISPSGPSWTSRRGADRLVQKRGLAEVVEADSSGPTVIRMREFDPRYASERKASLTSRELPFQYCWLNTEAAVIRFQGVKARWHGR